jgi:hypothetical protein
MDELSKIHAEVPGGTEAIEAEIAAKVRIKKYDWERKGTGGNVGFGRHHHGNQRGDRSYLNEDLNPDWSKKRKKGGSVITIKTLVEERYDRDEIDLIIDETRNLIVTHAAHGNADEPECLELRETLKELFQLLIDLDANSYDDDENFWDGERWRKTLEYIADESQEYGPNYEEEDDDHNIEVHLPLLAPYQHGDFNRNRDDERA